jgi:hypothetical protein
MVLEIFGEVHCRHTARAEFALNAISVGERRSQTFIRFARVWHGTNVRVRRVVEQAIGEDGAGRVAVVRRISPWTSGALTMMRAFVW